ncbi:alpha/beta hydrolase [Tepidimicrobium xylanilyticum]|uniref:Lysophospholipase, alpha-beta hydrolase superfamily n=1 Tax=Tepidimicrobium xylanilyticum TaxID=1123352 RepID=A0A1H2TRJ8_9FIRM|nr:alpha/beta hydrolase [Tepidimicrobium xylanilyticum]GMG95876.1 lysophospholipase [Tepidimicrobium xylanilyticum]SDW46377.1 Lysophospholipase, alpha-beta hydrolase superfamily [Tepidimicrobium xylanilyticum]
MENYIDSKDKTKLYMRKDVPKDVKANIIINHGFAEHLNRYDYVTKKLNEAKIGVYRYDLRGHGRSKGPKGHIDDFMDFAEDVDVMVDLVKSEYSNLPIFMLGHSMGGFITCLYGIKYPNKLKGQIFSGAAITKIPQVEGIKGDIFSLVNLILPKLKIKNPVSKDICSVKEVVEDYEMDPLVLKEATLNFYVQFLVKGIRWIGSNISKYDYPCLILHGEMDRIVPREASIFLYNNIKSKDKEIKIYDNIYHEILNENEKDRILLDIINWVYNRID